MGETSDIQKRVLIVSQTFPPAEGIGGRRWAKFAKYLRRQNVAVEVISADFPESNTKAWMDGIGEVPQYHYRHKYPAVLSKVPRSIFQKLHYRWALTRAALKADGTPYDRALYDEKAFLELLTSRLQQFKPQTLIVTSPPVNLVFYAAKIRNQFPEIKFIADFRDPWLDGNYYGYGNLRPSALEAEKAKEAFIVKQFDKILAVSPRSVVLDGLSKRHPEMVEKFELLPHGWDRDDVLGKGKPGIEVDMIYGGNLYKGFEPLLLFLKKYADKKNVQIEIYASSEVPEQALKTQGNFKIRKAIPVSEFFARIQQSKALLLLIPKGSENGFSTKVLEFAATKKGILAVGYPGTLSEFIVKKGLGSFVALDRLEEDFEHARKQLSKLRPDKKWINDHEIGQVTANLHSIIEKLT